MFSIEIHPKTNISLCFQPTFLEDFFLKEEKTFPYHWKRSLLSPIVLVGRLLLRPQVSLQVDRKKGLFLALEFFHCKVLIPAHVHKFGELFSPHRVKRKLK